MIRLMRDEAVEPARRDAMAVAAATFIHPKLAAIAHRDVNADGSPVRPVIKVYYKEIPQADAIEPLSEATCSRSPTR